MQVHQRIWHYLQQHRVASIAVGHVTVVGILGLLLLGNGLGMNIFGAFAQSPCSSSDHTYIVARGDTLGGIAARYRTSWQRLASYNHIANANVIYINQKVCIPGAGSGSGSGGGSGFNGPAPAKGQGNFFPYGQCTWYANQRFHQMHGVYVPWRTQSNAWQWTARAYQFGWRVSSAPSVGAIVNLQPWVQGAYSLGHVAVVERVLQNGRVLASNMNWGVYYWKVTYVEFTPGPGVSFLSY
ncbi:MAG TPA: CHAP domain-containing protein [Ktedonobacteraceae bacterium]